MADNFFWPVTHCVTLCLLETSCHVSDVYSWFAVPKKRQFSSKLLRWFYLNICFRLKEVTLSNISQKTIFQTCPHLEIVFFLLCDQLQSWKSLCCRPKSLSVPHLSRKEDDSVTIAHVLWLCPYSQFLCKSHSHEGDSTPSYHRDRQQLMVNSPATPISSWKIHSELSLTSQQHS